MTESPDGAVLSRTGRARSRPAAVVLVLHGGSETGLAATRSWNLSVLRMIPVARVIARTVRTAAVYRVRYAVRGWNGDGSAALRDTRWALAELRLRHPGLPIVLVGHSMGARVALNVGGDADVAGVVLLAPWAPPSDPATQLAGKPVVVISAGQDRVTPEAGTRAWQARAAVAGAQLTNTLLPWAKHGMLVGFWIWHRLAAGGVRYVLGASDDRT